MLWMHDTPPAPLSFTTERYSAETEFPAHTQPWGELHFALSGVVEIDIAGRRYLSTLR